MPQGKLKVKTKLPDGVKTKNGRKGPAISKRRNQPIQPKKKKFVESQKLKETVTKNVNKAVEDEIRSRAYDGAKKLSKAQEAVAAYNTAQSATNTT